MDHARVVTGWKAGLCVGLMLMCLAPARGAGRELAEQREVDESWGLSLRPPVGTRVVRRTADRYLMRILDDDEKFQLLVSVRRSTRPVTIAEVFKAAEADLRRIHETTRRLDRRDLEIDGRAGGLVYFDMPQTRGDGRLLLGQAFVQLAPDTLGLLEIEADMQDRAMAAATFESVLGSLELDLEEVAAERMAAAQAASVFQAGLDRPTVHGSLIEQQLFRIVDLPARGAGEPERDIGWMRIRQGEAERVGNHGVAVEVQARFFIEDKTYDSLAVYFVSDDGRYEDWSIKTTQRGVAARPGRQRDGESTPTDIETGIRTGSTIDVRIERDGGAVQTLSFTRPEAAYLPQAHAWLLPQLLPADEPAVYGFYWYNSAHRKLVYRTDEIVPALDRFTLITHPAPSDPELRATYGADRQLIEKSLSATRKLIPTTAAELRVKWPRG